MLNATNISALLTDSKNSSHQFADDADSVREIIEDTKTEKNLKLQAVEYTYEFGVKCLQPDDFMIFEKCILTIKTKHLEAMEE